MKTAIKINFTVVIISTFFLLGSCMSMKGEMEGEMKGNIEDHGSGIVWMKQDGFSPSTITVDVNTTITWLNKDKWHHSVTSKTDLFDSGKIKAGEEFSYKFIDKGTFSYHCVYHDMMIGKVIVQ